MGAFRLLGPIIAWEPFIFLGPIIAWESCVIVSLGVVVLQTQTRNMPTEAGDSIDMWFCASDKPRVRVKHQRGDPLPFDERLFTPTRVSYFAHDSFGLLPYDRPPAVSGFVSEVDDDKACTAQTLDGYRLRVFVWTNNYHGDKEMNATFPDQFGDVWLTADIADEEENHLDVSAPVGYFDVF